MGDRRCRCRACTYAKCSGVGENDLEVVVPAENSCLSGRFTVPYLCDYDYVGVPRKAFKYDTGATCVGTYGTYNKIVWATLGCMGTNPCAATVFAGWYLPPGSGCVGGWFVEGIMYKGFHSLEAKTSWSIPFERTVNSDSACDCTASGPPWTNATIAEA